MYEDREGEAVAACRPIIEVTPIVIGLSMITRAGQEA
jgi:hypothetical protein